MQGKVEICGVNTAKLKVLNQVEMDALLLRSKSGDKLAREQLPKKLEYWAAVMGLAPAGLSITGARTRFGSCSAQNRISLSWRIMQYPEAAIDYVVVHELAHIKEKNHSDRFYAIVEQYLPDYLERHKLLKG